MGSIPGLGVYRKQWIDVSLSHTDVSLSLSLSHPSSLSRINKHIQYPLARIKKKRQLKMFTQLSQHHTLKNISSASCIILPSVVRCISEHCNVFCCSACVLLCHYLIVLTTEAWYRYRYLVEFIFTHCSFPHPRIFLGGIAYSSIWILESTCLMWGGKTFLIAITLTLYIILKRMITCMMLYCLVSEQGCLSVCSRLLLCLT